MLDGYGKCVGDEGIVPDIKSRRPIIVHNSLCVIHKHSKHAQVPMLRVVAFN